LSGSIVTILLQSILATYQSWRSQATCARGKTARYYLSSIAHTLRARPTPRVLSRLETDRFLQGIILLRLAALLLVSMLSFDRNDLSINQLCALLAASALGLDGGRRSFGAKFVEFFCRP
jgi:hypothetical protein